MSIKGALQVIWFLVLSACAGDATGSAISGFKQGQTGIAIICLAFSALFFWLLFKNFKRFQAQGFK